MPAYIRLEELDAYKLAKKLGATSWNIFQGLSWEVKKMTGYQFVDSTDSIAANIAEGYGRFHYLDKVKFYYNARGSLLESKHWMDTLSERKLAPENDKREYYVIHKKLSIVLARLISATMKAKYEYKV